MTEDARAAKLALARKKLKDHQEKKCVPATQQNLETTHNHSSEPSIVREDVILGSTSDKIDSNSSTCEHHYTTQVNTGTQGTQYQATNPMPVEPRVDVTEILISTKIKLEAQVLELQSKITDLENSLRSSVESNNQLKQQNHNLEVQLKNLQTNYETVSEVLASKDKIINEYNTTKTSLTDENNNLMEQLEFTKNILSTKDMEISSLSNQLFYMQNQLDATHLQLQQLTGLQTGMQQSTLADSQYNAQELLKKISNLEQQLNMLHKEKVQSNLHYEHYVNELNDQLKSVVSKNAELNNEVQTLSDRENSLIEQLSGMEIRLQNYRAHHATLDHNTVQNANNDDFEKLQKDYDNVQEKLKNLICEHEELHKKFTETDSTLKELSEEKELVCIDETRNLEKLSADITSDKVAAQRATEQNKKLKIDVQELEGAFVKISKDKLELTEKVAAEKFLNRELTIKLAEIEEKANNLQVKLKAKDEEMMRLLTNYRHIESQYKKYINNPHKPDISEHNENGEINDHNHDDHDGQCSVHGTASETEHEIHNHEHTNDVKHACLMHQHEEDHHLKMPREDAMLKLQDRFLKIMGDVADLSDEKHRLEHIILQLQNETDTICEYVALYQQQRSLLKKRDEERSAQVKIFQAECEMLRKQLEELNHIIVKFTKDKELSAYFEDETKLKQVRKAMDLLSNLKSNTLIDPTRENSELKNFHPCSCCSGQLIEV